MRAGKLIRRKNAAGPVGLDGVRGTDRVPGLEASVELLTLPVGHDGVELIPLGALALEQLLKDVFAQRLAHKLRAFKALDSLT